MAGLYEEEIGPGYIAEAVSYRLLDRKS